MTIPRLSAHSFSQLRLNGDVPRAIISVTIGLKSTPRRPDPLQTNKSMSSVIEVVDRSSKKKISSPDSPSEVIARPKVLAVAAAASQNCLIEGLLGLTVLMVDPAKVLVSSAPAIKIPARICPTVPSSPESTATILHRSRKSTRFLDLLGVRDGGVSRRRCWCGTAWCVAFPQGRAADHPAAVVLHFVCQVFCASARVSLLIVYGLPLRWRKRPGGLDPGQHRLINHPADPRYSAGGMLSKGELGARA
jgi:hypothetical protein